MDSLSVGKDADIIAVSDNPLDGITVHLKCRFCYEKCCHMRESITIFWNIHISSIVLKSQKE